MLVTIAAITYHSTAGLQESADWVSQRHQFLDHIGSFELDLTEADSAARGFLLASDEQYLPAYEKARACREPVIAMLERRLAKISAG